MKLVFTEKLDKWIQKNHNSRKFAEEKLPIKLIGCHNIDVFWTLSKLKKLYHRSNKQSEYTSLQYTSLVHL